MSPKEPKLSDRELRQLLASLREEVAAPRDFRQRVLRQIAPQAAPQPSHSPLRPVFEFFAKPAMLPVAAALTLAVGAWLALKSQAPLQAPAAQAHVPQVVAQLPSSGTSQPSVQTAKAQLKPSAPMVASRDGGASSAPSAKGTLAQGPAAAPQVANSKSSGAALAAERGGMQTMPAAPLTRSSERPAPALAQNSAPGLPSLPSTNMGNVGAAQASAAKASQDKPIIIILTPSPTPLAKPLASNSEVRGNKVLVSRGGYASILFKLKTGGHVRIEISDRLGRLVAVAAEGDYPSGLSEVRWYGHDDSGEVAATGIYLVRIKGPDFDERHKVVLVK